HAHRDLPAEVTQRHRLRHLGDVADLAREVAGHEVHAVRQVLPGTGDAADVGLAAQLAFRTHLAGPTGAFRNDGPRLVHHPVDRIVSPSVLPCFLTRRSSARTPTVIFRLRSPGATAFVTSAMLRTWLVRLPAMKFTLSVRSFHVPATPRTSAWPPSLPSVPTS